MAKRHSKEGRNHLEQESSRQRTMEGIGGGLEPAVDRQNIDEGEGEVQVLLYLNLTSRRSRFVFAFSCDLRFHRLEFVSLICILCPLSFWYLVVNIISRNHGLLARFLLWTRVCLSWQMAVLYNDHPSNSVSLAISTAAQPSLLAFARSRYSRALLLSLYAKT